MNVWRFFIDVGGTFTDVIARRPDGRILTLKLLSSGAIRGQAGPGSTRRWLLDARRIRDPKDFWVGYTVSLVDTVRPGRHTACESGRAHTTPRVASFDPALGELTLDNPIDSGAGGGTRSLTGSAYELRGGEEAPVVAIRYLMGLSPGEPIGPIEVRLGTTRATNALLERKGARVALVTTAGFADILRIGYQDRPALFDLNIRKRDELAEVSIEIDERLAADGTPQRVPRADHVRRQLDQAKATGIEALAVCLLHAHVNPVHEETVAAIAKSVGFNRISVSSRVAPLERIVPRGDTTVADAYLSSVIETYLSSLRRSLPEANLNLMTSHGGLMAADAVSGKDTILSGPAGGVVGCAHVTRRAGFDRAIGFDMGGTSTDVCRVAIDDGEPDGFDYTYETVKAGVRIMTPMLAVETVAAGGGSICAFDGQMLTVGPQSAGADPGPACYGQGGPLTLTDMNLILGRIAPDHFPFPLDPSAIDRGLDALAAEVHERTGKRLESVALAEGFVRIANDHMSAAIKRISIAKGYDVRDYVLCSFGGAGGQHACAVARNLGITRILLNPYAGVLSALGIGVTDVKRIAQRSVRRFLDPEALESLRPTFETLTGSLREALGREGVPGDRLSEPVWTLDVAYDGQDTFITVPMGSADEITRRFEALHEQLYGYRHRHRRIQVRVVRVSLAAKPEPLAFFDAGCAPTVSPSGTGSALGGSTVTAPRTADMIVEGRSHRVPLFLRTELSPDQSLSGPAIVIEETGTIIIDPGWRATVTRDGDIVLRDARNADRKAPSGAGALCGGTENERPRGLKHAARGKSSQANDGATGIATSEDEPDPIQLELFNNRFTAIAERMGATLRRTALSTNVKERLDYSCAIFTPQGDLVVNAPHIPVHLGAMSDCVKALSEDVGELEPGQAYITNDPYRGGSHLNDVTVISPVHEDGGTRLAFFVASRAHHAEIGGSAPGSMPPDSTSLAQEGVLIRAFAWKAHGQSRSDALRALLTAPPYPSRAPDDNLADIAAQVAANQTGIRELHALAERYGRHVVQRYMRHIQSAAEAKMRKCIRELPDGVRTFKDSLDDGSAIRVAITIEGDQATIDFSGTAPVLPGNLNANRAIVKSAVLYCLRCLIDEEIPLNSGMLAPVTIVLPECFLNPSAETDPRISPAVVGGNVETSQRIVDVVLGALGVAAASQGTMNNLLLGDETFGYYETICGGAGAGEGFDGADAVHTHMTNTRMTDPEVLEARYPIRLLRFQIRKDSGGRGAFRGGDGVIRELECMRPLTMSILSQRRLTSPYGLRGGESGKPGRNLLLRAGSDSAVELPPIAHLTLEPGDRLTILTPGGGGYGAVR